MTIETTDAPQVPATLSETPDFGGLAGLAALQQWADANDQATRLVARWIFTDLVPKHHWPMPKGESARNFPNPRIQHPRESEEDYRHRCEVAAASAAGTVLRGMALALPPNVALEQMHSIHGRVGMSAKLKYALALSRGVDAWDVDLTRESCTVAGIHPRTGDTVEITVTMDDARVAGWTENDTYKKTPKDMLWARAMSRLLDRIAGHVLFGLPSIEDLADLPADQADGRPTSAAPKVRLEQLTASLAEPALPEAAPAAETTVPPKARQAQLARIGAAFDQLRVTDVGERIGYASALTGRVLKAAGELTAAEADSVVDQLEQAATWAQADADAWGDELLKHAEALDQPQASSTEQPGGARG